MAFGCSSFLKSTSGQTPPESRWVLTDGTAGHLPILKGSKLVVKCVFHLEVSMADHSICDPQSCSFLSKDLEQHIL
ncbi:hypothetical protein AMECASPLE_015202, partial [Ameca splendens]